MIVPRAWCVRLLLACVWLGGLGCKDEARISLLEREPVAIASAGPQDAQAALDDLDADAPERSDALADLSTPVQQQEANAGAELADQPIAGQGGNEAQSPQLALPGSSDSVTGLAKEAAGSLVLRYDFEGRGERVMDRVGTAHARVIGGAALDGSGGLELDGHDDYVDMPNGILSGLHRVTIMAWLTWRGAVCWQRVFDFGSTDAGEDRVGSATTSLFLTPSSCPDGVLTFMTERDVDKQSLFTRAPLPPDHKVQVALVLDSDTSQVALYVNGRLQAIDQNHHAMSDLHDVNNWLGRSQWIQDRFLRGRFDELRIYDDALSGDQVRALAELGPDVL